MMPSLREISSAYAHGGGGVGWWWWWWWYADRSSIYLINWSWQRDRLSWKTILEQLWLQFSASLEVVLNSLVLTTKYLSVLNLTKTMVPGNYYFYDRNVVSCFCGSVLSARPSRVTLCFVEVGPLRRWFDKPSASGLQTLHQRLHEIQGSLVSKVEVTCWAARVVIIVWSFGR